VIQSAPSIVVAGLFGYWHAPYAWVIGLSVLFFLKSHKASLRIARQDPCTADSTSLILTNFVTMAIFLAVNICFIATHFTMYFLLAWLH
jgi:hypothetical protein